MTNNVLSLILVKVYFNGLKMNASDPPERNALSAACVGTGESEEGPKV